ncbi:MAG TPA: hypothetical protein VEY06_07425 [Flavisolibacter sp.]|jgi:hypothetical protein|nr:hypothetical protein [Flavisolibacter sp.]
MKKYTLVLAMGLLTTAAVTATVLANKEPVKKEVKVKEVKKVEKKKSCSREKTSCFFS